MIEKMAQAPIYCRSKFWNIHSRIADHVEVDESLHHDTQDPERTHLWNWLLYRHTQWQDFLVKLINFSIIIIIIIIIYPLAARIVGHHRWFCNQFPLFPLFLHCPLELTPGLSIPWCCLPTEGGCGVGCILRKYLSVAVIKSQSGTADMLHKADPLGLFERRWLNPTPPIFLLLLLLFFLFFFFVCACALLLVFIANHSQPSPYAVGTSSTYSSKNL